MTEEQQAPAASYEDLFDTGPKTSPGADAGATAPVQVQAAPVQVDATPVQVQASPVQVDAAPVQVQASPVQVDATPVQVEASPVQVDAAPAPPDAPAAEAGGEGLDDALAEFEADLEGDIGPNWDGAEAPADAPPPDPRIEALKRALEAKGFTPERIADVMKMMGRKPLPGSFTKEEAQAPPPEEPPAQEAAPEEEGGKKKMKKVDPEMLARLMAEQEAEEAAAAAQQTQEQQAADPAQGQQAGYTQTPCYNCGAMVDIPPQRPATVVCANCGTQGVIN
jgi:hypothetical protein